MNMVVRQRGIRLILNCLKRTRPGARIDELREIERRLSALAVSTEGEFISLGDALQRFTGQSRKIWDLSSSLAAMMSGKEVTEAAEGLRQIIARVKESDSGSKQGTEILKVILSRIEEIHRPLIGFAKIVRNLRVLCNFIKVESARLVSADAGFTTLSEDVGRLAAKIESKTTDLFEQSIRLSSRVRENLKKIAEFETSGHGQALQILDGTDQCLNSLTEKHRLSSAAVHDVNLRWERISRAIGEVVSSLQFHDITRQRIEHVKEALAQVTEGLADLQTHRMTGGHKRNPVPDSGRDTGSGVSNRITVIGRAIGACEVQRAQLEHAGTEVVSAVERILAELDDTARQVREMCEETRNLVKGKDTSGNSFLASLDEGVSQIARSLGDYGHINDQLSETIDHAAHTIGAMSAFIEEIEKIGIEIRMIALNSCIRAAHVGERGASLGVLADTIHDLSGETTRHASAISTGLKMIISSAEELTSRVRDNRGANGGEKEHLEGDIIRMVEPLHRVDQSAMTLLTRMVEQGREFSDDIAKTAGGIEVHRQFDREISQIRADLGGIVAHLRALLPEDSRSEQIVDWAQLEDRYTMNRERDVHRLVMGKTTVVSPVDAPLDASSSEGKQVGDDKEGLGDNVELF